MQEKTAGNVGYIPEFDGLRAFAVALVLADHYGGGILETIGDLLPIGLYGLRIFFVLSGFLITTILIDSKLSLSDGDKEWTVRHALSRFFTRRFLRIVPVFYLLLVLEFFFGNDAFRQVMWWHFAYLSNTVSAVFNGPMATGGLAHPATGHLWSLAIEVQFYLFWPFLVLLLSPKRLVQVTLFLVILAPVSRAYFFAIGYQFDVGYIISATDTLCAGGLLAMWRQGWVPWVSRDMIGKIAFTSAAIYAACIAASIQSLWYRPQMIIYPFAEGFLYSFVLLLFLEGKLAPIARALRTRWVVYLGRISYGIYLYHSFVWDRLKEHVIDLTATQPFTQTIIATLATIAFASVSWWAIETPLLRLKRRLA